MGAQIGGRDEQTREEERVIWYLFSGVVAILFFVAGLGAGARWFGDEAPAHSPSSRDSLIQCEEDEAWYPADFDPPTEVSDLECIHQDVLAP